MTTVTETVIVEGGEKNAELSLKTDQNTRSNGTVVLIKHPKLSKADFGAEVYGIDLNNFTDADFDLISDALHRHKLLVFKEQPAMLVPQQQYRLTSLYAMQKDSHEPFHVTDKIRLDPDDTSGGFAHGADPYLTSYKGIDIYGLPNRPAIPVQPQVHILGRGKLPENHYQFPPDFEMTSVDHVNFHLPPHIPQEERDQGASRFYQW